ncbi:MAG: hypothetical protein QXV17_07590 [Candidatus Micrarchaeaceae archaeon]
MANVEKMIPLNWAIIKEPLNWIILFLMVLFAGLAAEVIMQWIKQTNDFNFTNS